MYFCFVILVLAFLLYCFMRGPDIFFKGETLCYCRFAKVYSPIPEQLSHRYRDLLIQCYNVKFPKIKVSRVVLHLPPTPTPPPPPAFVTGQY